MLDTYHFSCPDELFDLKSINAHQDILLQHKTSVKSHPSILELMRIMINQQILSEN